jgi:putative transposase
MNCDEASAGEDVAGKGASSKPAESRRSGCSAQSYPPFNPELYKMVRGKQTWAEPSDEEAKAKGFRGWHQRGYLPHHDVPVVRQFVTLRLVDAMPASRRGEWEALLRIEDNRQRRTKLEEYLDRGLGECWLRQPRIAAIVEGAFRFFEGERYRLRAWVVMPNHAHVLVEVSQTPLAELLHSWKGFSAREANKLLGRTVAFWEREYWDTKMRHDEQERKAVRYIEANPVKAGLTAEAKEWAWSSARFRDGYGVLRLPEPGEAPAGG